MRFNQTLLFLEGLSDLKKIVGLGVLVFYLLFLWTESLYVAQASLQFTM